MQTRDEITARLQTYAHDLATNEANWDELVQEEDTAYSILEERFGPWRGQLEAEREELDFLSKLIIIDGCPLYQDIDRGLTTLKAFPTADTPRRTAMFNAAAGRSTLSINAGKGEYMYFRFDFEDLEVTRAHANNWLIDGVKPPLVYAITLAEMQATAPKPEPLAPELL
jgi:hypothetical protein